MLIDLDQTWTILRVGPHIVRSTLRSCLDPLIVAIGDDQQELLEAAQAEILRRRDVAITHAVTEFSRNLERLSETFAKPATPLCQSCSQAGVVPGGTCTSCGKLAPPEGGPA